MHTYEVFFLTSLENLFAFFLIWKFSQEEYWSKYIIHLICFFFCKDSSSWFFSWTENSHFLFSHRYLNILVRWISLEHVFFYYSQTLFLSLPSVDHVQCGYYFMILTFPVKRLKNLPNSSWLVKSYSG